MENQIKFNIPVAIVIASIILSGTWVYTQKSAIDNKATVFQGESHENETTLPVKWGDLGVKMIDVGVIDAEKFELLYSRRGGLPEDMKKLLYGKNNGKLKISAENSGIILNLLWALGLGNKNGILENGPMMNARPDGAAGYASTAGWVLAKGDPMEHYSRHPFIVLTRDQQALVERVSKNVYRPCCSNSTYFPDCNHGMAMLGLLELMASQGADEKEMYDVAKKVNAYWFPELNQSSPCGVEGPAAQSGGCGV